MTAIQETMKKQNQRHVANSNQLRKMEIKAHVQDANDKTRVLW
jgi:hypothetical protein